jgi:asparagine synthase (glutamine-hydrolysing)
MRQLAQQYLTDEAITNTGLLDVRGVNNLLALYQAEKTPLSTKVRLDAVINHLLGIQILYQHFIATDVPTLARQRAQTLGWVAQGSDTDKVLN